MSRMVLTLLAFAGVWSNALPAFAQCVPACAGKECGDDGCGGSCGDCGQGETCVVDRCVYACGSVGYEGCCYQGYLVWCSEAERELHFVSCQGDTECGWDSSTPYLESYSCVPPPGLPDPSGTYPMECDFTCRPECEGKECGDDQCGGECGECAPGQTCWFFKCCTPQCAGKECGEDGCGSECGQCAEGFWCTDFFRCAYGYGCVETSFPGCKGCACATCVCQIDPFCCEERWDWKCTYECQFSCGGCVPCEPQCEGKECGEDECGWSCGDCPDGMTCRENRCVSLPPEKGDPDSPEGQDQAASEPEDGGGAVEDERPVHVEETAVLDEEPIPQDTRDGAEDDDVLSDQGLNPRPERTNRTDTVSSDEEVVPTPEVSSRGGGCLARDPGAHLGGGAVGFLFMWLVSRIWVQVRRRDV